MQPRDGYEGDYERGRRNNCGGWAKLAARLCGGTPCAEGRVPHTVPGPQSGTPKDFRELAEVKGDAPPLPMIPRLRGMCSSLLFLTLIFGIASTARAWT
jgi:hypothetical protein